MRLANDVFLDVLVFLDRDKLDELLAVNVYFRVFIKSNMRSVCLRELRRFLLKQEKDGKFKLSAIPAGAKK